MLLNVRDHKKDLFFFKLIIIIIVVLIYKDDYETEWLREIAAF